MISTIGRCIGDLVRITDKYQSHLGMAEITRFLNEWRVQENALIYRGVSSLPREEHARRMISYRLGGSDQDMATRVGMRGHSFFTWRTKQRLPSKGRLGNRKVKSLL